MEVLISKWKWNGNGIWNCLGNSEFDLKNSKSGMQNLYRILIFYRFHYGYFRNKSPGTQ